VLKERPLGGDPPPIRVMSQDLVLFRDDQDQARITRTAPAIAAGS
jgi:hypothetical protein